MAWWKMGNDVNDSATGTIYDVVGSYNGTPVNMEAADLEEDSPAFVVPYGSVTGNPLTKNSVWWQARAERNAIALRAADAWVNKNKQTMLSSIENTNKRAQQAPYRFGGSGNFTLGGVGFNQNKKVNFVYRATAPFGPVRSNAATNVIVGLGSEVEQLRNSTDVYHPAYKQRLGFQMDPDANRSPASVRKGDGNMFLPFSLYSSSVTTAANATVVNSYATGTMITNLHHDLVYNSDIPLQSPFTEKFVGGRQYRHTEINAGSDDHLDRAEGWKIEFSGVDSATGADFDTPMMGVVPPNYEGGATNDTRASIPTAQRLRNVGTKRPVNIQNIKMVTSSLGTRLSGVIAQGSIGNYQKNYQVVQSNAREKNDPFFNDQSFDFALHPETLATRGRPPLTPLYRKSLYFAGTNQAVYWGDIAASAWDPYIGGSSTNAKPMTWAFWMKAESGGDAYPDLIHFGNSQQRIIQIFDADGAFTTYNISWKINGATTLGYARSTPNGMTAGTWHHVVATFAGGNSGALNLYIDGVLDNASSQTLNGPYDLSSGNPFIAGVFTNDSYKGYLCDVCCWSRELTATEARNLYGAGNRVNPRMVAPDQLLSWLPLGSGPDVVDGGFGLTDQAGNAIKWPGKAVNNPVILTGSAASPPFGGYGSYTQNKGGDLDYLLPNRTGADSNQSIIVNRFAGCGYEVMSRGYMDPAHEELSVYNALPYRNLAVINYGLSGSASVDPIAAQTITVVDQIGKNRGLDQRSSLHCGPFGSDAAYGSVPALTYVTTPSYHKTNRNPFKRTKAVPVPSALGFGSGQAGQTTRLTLGNGDTWQELIGGAKALTISLWVKVDALDSSGAFLFDTLPAGLLDLSGWISATGQIYYRRGGHTMVTAAGVITPDPNRWWHITFTQMAGAPYTSTIYVKSEGKESTTVSTTGSEVILGGLVIGKFTSGTTYNLIGQMSNLAIWTRDLSASEVDFIYNEGEPYAWLANGPNRYANTRAAGAGVSNGLVAWYRFDSRYGDTQTEILNQIQLPETQNGVKLSTNSTIAGIYNLAPASGTFNHYDFVTTYDNHFVQHAIPRSTQQYSWVSSSLANGRALDSLYAPSAISASEIPGLMLSGSGKARVAYGSGRIKNNFVGYGDHSFVAPAVSLGTTTLAPHGGNTATFMSGTGVWAGKFDGTTSYVDVGAHATWETLIGGSSTSAKAFTISAWIDPDLEGMAESGFIFAVGNRGASGRSLYMSDDGLIYFWIDGSTDGRIATTVPIDGGQVSDVSGFPSAGNKFHHIAATFAGNTAGAMKIYVNGEEQPVETISTLSSPNSIASYDASLGCENLGGTKDYFFEGYIADVSIFASAPGGIGALTAAQVKKLYNDGIPMDVVANFKGGNYESNPFFGDTTPTAFWRFGDSTLLPGNAQSATGLSILNQTGTGSTTGTGSNVSTELVPLGPPNLHRNLINQNGPYGYSTWKQIRAGQGPVGRKLRKENLIGALVPPPTVPGANGFVQGLKSNQAVNYYEPPIDYSKSRPIIAAFEDNAADADPANNVVLKIPFQNKVEYFDNQGLNNRLGLQSRYTLTNPGPFEEVVDYGLSSSLSAMYRYGQKMYPAITNVGSAKVRTRENYSILDVWNDVRRYRNVGGLAISTGAQAFTRPADGSGPWSTVNNPMLVTGASGHCGGESGEVRVTVDPTVTDPSTLRTITMGGAKMSAWPLDAYDNLALTGALAGKLGGMATAGILQNSYCRYGVSGSNVPGTPWPSASCSQFTMTASACYVYPFSAAKWGYKQTGSTTSPPKLPSGSTYLVGFQRWTAAEQTGISPYKPYSVYSANIQKLGKGMSIVPEFRISELMKQYDQGGYDFLQKLGDTFSLTGSRYPDSSYGEFYKTYTNADFLKFFKVVDEKLDGKVNEGGAAVRRHAIELRADALLQFLPYKGFYPAERTAELARLFDYSMADYSMLSELTVPPADKFGAAPNGMKAATTAFKQVIYEPLFAPGILFNTIKSGIAVSNFVVCNTQSFSPTDISQMSEDGGRGGSYADSLPPNAWRLPIKPMSEYLVGAGRPDSTGPTIDIPLYMTGATIGGVYYPATAGQGLGGNAPALGLGTAAGSGSNATTPYSSNNETHGSLPCGLNIGLGSSAPADMQGWKAEYKAIHTYGPGDHYKQAVGGYFMHRIPFEAIRNPERYLANTVVPNSRLFDTGTGFASFVYATQNRLMESNKTYVSYHPEAKSQLYKFAIDNFLCETYNFFQTTPKSFISKEEDDFLPVEKDKYYGLTIALKQDYSVNPGKGFVSNININAPTKFGMYNNYPSFGPPIGIKQMATFGFASNHAQTYDGVTWEHVLPPQYFGFAAANIIFKAPYTGKVTLEEIQGNSVIEYDKACLSMGASDDLSNYFGSNVYVDLPKMQSYHEMETSAFMSWNGVSGSSMTWFPRSQRGVFNQISSSVNLTEKLLVVPPGTNQQKARWLVQPKFECPVMNFMGAPASRLRTGVERYQSGYGLDAGNPATAIYCGFKAYNYSVPWNKEQWSGLTSGSFDKSPTYMVRGMWHQYGSIPTGSEGIDFSLKPLREGGSTYTSTNYGEIQLESLADIVGFDTIDKKIGTLKEAKRIEEAIVCVPFITVGGERRFFDVEINSQEYITQLSLLKKYTFPPTFDFLLHPSVNPVAFYAFEFSAELDQEDLQRIWQNLPPKLAESSKFQKQTVQIRIRALVDKLLGTDQDLEWMVFKVKRTAEKDYNIFMRKNLIEGTPIVQPTLDTPYSYNWPYDYFSLVELVSIDQEVVYTTEDIAQTDVVEDPVMPDLQEFIPTEEELTFRLQPSQNQFDIAEAIVEPPLAPPRNPDVPQFQGPQGPAGRTLIATAARDAKGNSKPGLEAAVMKPARKRGKSKTKGKKR